MHVTLQFSRIPTHLLELSITFCLLREMAWKMTVRYAMYENFTPNYLVASKFCTDAILIRKIPYRMTISVLSITLSGYI